MLKCFLQIRKGWIAAMPAKRPASKRPATKRPATRLRTRKGGLQGAVASKHIEDCFGLRRLFRGLRQMQQVFRFRSHWLQCPKGYSYPNFFAERAPVAVPTAFANS